MTYASRAANSYLQTQVKSSSPLELVVLLYDGALRATAAANDALERRDIPARRTAMSKAMALVGELQATLDMDKGGAVATELTGFHVDDRAARRRDGSAGRRSGPRSAEGARDAARRLAPGGDPGASARIRGMTPDDARQLLEQYRAGVDAESRLLHQLADIALRQHDVTQASDLTLFNQVADTRDAIMRSLVTLEDELRSLRQSLTEGRETASPIDGTKKSPRATARRPPSSMQSSRPIIGRLPRSPTPNWRAGAPSPASSVAKPHWPPTGACSTPTRQREAGGQGGIGWVCGCVGPCQVAADTFLSAGSAGARACRLACGMWRRRAVSRRARHEPQERQLGHPPEQEVILL